MKLQSEFSRKVVDIEVSHLLAEYAVSANCCVQQKKCWHRQHGSVSVALCWQKAWLIITAVAWTGVLWALWWLIVVFDGNSCGNSVGLGLIIDDRSWLMVGFDDSSCGIVWIRVDWWWTLMITAVGQLSRMIDSWQVWRDWWRQVVGLLIVCRRVCKKLLLTS